MDGLYVKKSSINGAGGGLFTSLPIRKGTFIGIYSGIRVSKATAMDSNYTRGYLLDVGSHYIDARDPLGRLVMNDGRLVNSHDQTDAWWSKLRGRGVGWKGAANLMRYANSADRTARQNNLVIRKGVSGYVASRDVKAGDELLASYGPSFWNSPNDVLCWRCDKPGFLVECDRCTRAWHLNCCGVKKKENLPRGKWYCPSCVKR